MFMFNIHNRNDKKLEIDEKYIIRVRDYMVDLPRPAKQKVVVNYDEILPIITGECD